MPKAFQGTQKQLQKQKVSSYYSKIKDMAGQGNIQIINEMQERKLLKFLNNNKVNENNTGQLSIACASLGSLFCYSYWIY